MSYAGKEELIDQYVAALCEEIRSLPTPNSKLQTIFFGGGTPTLLEPKHFERLLSTINFPLSTIEISVEANPGTADLAKLKALRSLGINRLSIGVQSFNDQHLKTLGRIHDSATAKRFYDDARAAGFENINLDLIYGLPSQTLAEWKTDLQTAIALKPDHLSAYGLQIEEGTPFHVLLRTPNSQLPTEDLSLAMYEHAIETLTAAGYKHYEISNFAKPGYECRHNLTYWRNDNYLGVGAGAHSHINGQRWANPNSIEEYLRRGEEDGSWERSGGMRRGNTPNPSPSISHDSSPSQSETIFLGLRLLDGLPTKHFSGFEKEVAELKEEGLLTEQDGNYKLTRKGLYLGNEVFARFV